MLAEVLLVLAGHPSSFFIPYPAEEPESLKIAPTLSRHLHPGEEQALNQLAQLAFHYTTIRTWARNIQERGRQGVLAEALRKGKGKAVEVPDAYTSTLAGSILDVLQDYELLLIQVETDVLRLDEGVAQDELGYVPLSILLAKFSAWQGTLGSLKTLVDKLSSSELTPGQLLDHLVRLSDNGNTRLSDMYRSLYRSLLRLFLTYMVTFLLSGIAPTVSTPTSPSIAIDAGTDPLSPQHRVYTLNTDLFPESIASETRESILYVGRVASTLKREGRSLPKVMVDDLRRLIMSVEELDDELERAIQRTREEAGEWLWKHVLTGPQVAEALKSLWVSSPA
jgi:gamma-tubulin complex component 4